MKKVIQKDLKTKKLMENIIKNYNSVSVIELQNN